MAGIISALLAIFGPILGELLRKWLDSLFKKAAKNLEGRQFGSPAAASVALCDEALRLTGRARPGRRVILKRIRANAGNVVQGFDLPPDVREEIAEVAKLTD